jgi:hypothetical protein
MLLRFWAYTAVSGNGYGVHCLIYILFSNNMVSGGRGGGRGETVKYVEEG